MKSVIAILFMAVSCCELLAGRSIRGNSVQPYWFDVSSTGLSRVVTSASTASVSTGEIVNSVSYTPTIKHDIQLYSATISAMTSGQIGWASSSPSVATVDSNGFVTHVSDGSVIITASTARLTRSIPLTFSTTMPTTQSVFTGYVGGSLANHINTSLDAMLSGSGVEANCKFFSAVPSASVPSSDGTTSYYTRNAAIWSGTTCDFTGISVWNSDATWCGAYGMNSIHGTMITPMHVLTCNHYHWGNGCTLYFVKQDGTVIQRTISKGSQVGTSDVYIGVLNSPVPSGIKVYEVLPTNFLNYFSGHSIPQGLTGVVIAQVPSASPPNSGHLKNAWIMRIMLPTITNSVPLAQYTIGIDTSNATRAAYKLPSGWAVSGDSGAPSFFRIDGSLVVIGCFHDSGGAADASLLGYHDRINAMMSGTGALSTSGTAYTLTDHNMALWPTQ